MATSNITSKFTNILGLDCIGIYYFISIIFTCGYYYLHVIFSEIRRIEEVQDSDSSPRREEVGRRTLRGYGGFLLPFFYRDRFREFTRQFPSPQENLTPEASDRAGNTRIDFSSTSTTSFII